jgi:hypothetical protein
MYKIPLSTFAPAITLSLQAIVTIIPTWLALVCVDQGFQCIAKYNEESKKTQVIVQTGDTASGTGNEKESGTESKKELAANTPTAIIVNPLQSSNIFYIKASVAAFAQSFVVCSAATLYSCSAMSAAGAAMLHRPLNTYLSIAATAVMVGLECAAAYIAKTPMAKLGFKIEL